MEVKLSRILKRVGVTQIQFQRTLKDKYNLVISDINKYCIQQAPTPYHNWKIILECLKNEYGIVYRNSQWEVMNNGN